MATLKMRNLDIKLEVLREIAKELREDLNKKEKKNSHFPHVMTQEEIIDFMEKSIELAIVKTRADERLMILEEMTE